MQRKTFFSVLEKFLLCTAVKKGKSHSQRTDCGTRVREREVGVGVLLGMNFYKSEGNYLEFVASIGSPDENNEEFYLISVTIDNLGNTKCKAYQAPKEEDIDE